MKLIFSTMVLMSACFGLQKDENLMEFIANTAIADACWIENKKEEALRMYDILVTQTKNSILIKAIQLRKGLLEDEMGLDEAAAEDIFMAVQFPGLMEHAHLFKGDMKSFAVNSILKKSAKFKEKLLIRP